MLRLRLIEEGVHHIVEGSIPSGDYYFCHKYSDFDQIEGIKAEQIVSTEDEDTGKKVDRFYEIKLVFAGDPDIHDVFPIIEDEELYRLTTIAMVTVEGDEVRYACHSSIPQKRIRSEAEDAAIDKILTEDIDLGFY